VSILGNRVLRKEDARFLRGEGTYVENLPLEGALAVTFVRSLLAHARISVDVSAAKDVPGVQVFTGADVDVAPLAPSIPGPHESMARPLVASDIVRFVGEIVAVVVSDDRASGVDAAELVMIDYDPLPVVVAPRDAAKDEVLLFPDAGTNVAARAGDPEHDDALFDGCDAVVSGWVTSPRIAPCPLEPRSAAAVVGDDGRLTAWLSTQAPHADLAGLSEALGLEPAQIRVVAPDVGGGFGAKLLGVEEILVAWVATRVGRPVRWTETRSESMVALQHGRAAHMEFTLGGTRDGLIRAYRLEVLQDAGAYPVVGSFLPNFIKLMASGVYAIPTIEFESRSVVTNTTPITAFRGAGRPEACQAIERAVELFAAEIGLDSIEVRRRNFIRTFPHTTVTGANYDSGDYEGALDLVLESAGIDELRAEQQQLRDEGGPIQLGIGVASYIEITNPISETEFGEVEITGEGGAILRTGSFSHGQGHETTFAQIASARLGIPVESITVHKGDTDEIPKGTGTYGSKSAQIGGTAAQLAAEDVVTRARDLAADYLEVSVEDVRLDVGAGRFQVAGAPQRGISWPELAERASSEGKLELLRAAQDFHGTPTFPFGCHVAVVEVDTETGHVELRRFVAVDDAGTLINPLVVDGQVHGGVATGVSQALFETFVYDEDGTPVTNTFAGYAFPAAADLPSWERIEMQTPTPHNPLGAKGIGESGTMGSTPAVQSAVIDALAPFGVRNVEMPVNGENVWRALEEARA
jgi:aerobic carbon-monoxide dehydrogenase large subunit